MVVIVPDWITGLVFEELQFLIKINVCGQGKVCVVSGAEVSHTTGGNTKTSYTEREKERTLERDLYKLWTVSGAKLADSVGVALNVNSLRQDTKKQTLNWKDT